MIRNAIKEIVVGMVVALSVAALQPTAEKLGKRLAKSKRKRRSGKQRSGKQ